MKWKQYGNQASTVEPRFTNAPVHEQIFRAKSLWWRTVSRITNMQAGNSGKLATASSWEYRRGSVSCWLTNLVSVYEHFGSRTASRNELSSWTEVPLYDPNDVLPGPLIFAKLITKGRPSIRVSDNLGCKEVTSAGTSLMSNCYTKSLDATLPPPPFIKTEVLLSLLRRSADRFI
jgi:hypothetical protein